MGCYIKNDTGATKVVTELNFYPLYNACTVLWPIPSASDSGPSPLRLLFGLSVLFGTAYLIDSMLEPARPVRRRRFRNVEPLEEWKKEYVFRRDGRRCVYCTRRVTRATRHVDHRISRLNGGTNHLNNLGLACQQCNLLKGSLNAREFTR